jgi:hypothetical protein
MYFFPMSPFQTHDIPLLITTSQIIIKAFVNKPFERLRTVARERADGERDPKLFGACLYGANWNARTITPSDLCKLIILPRTELLNGT